MKCWCLLYEWTYSLPSYRKVQCTVVSLYIFLAACQSVCFDDVCFWCQWHLEYLLFTAYTWCSSFLVCSCQTLAQKKPSPTEGGHSHPEPLQRCSSTRHVHRFCVFFLQSAELAIYQHVLWILWKHPTEQNHEASLPTEAQKQLENAQMETDLQRSRVADMKDGLQRKLIRFCRNAIKWVLDTTNIH